MNCLNFIRYYSKFLTNQISIFTKTFHKALRKLEELSKFIFNLNPNSYFQSLAIGFIIAQQQNLGVSCKELEKC